MDQVPLDQVRWPARRQPRVRPSGPHLSCGPRHHSRIGIAAAWEGYRSGCDFSFAGHHCGCGYDPAYADPAYAGRPSRDWGCCSGCGAVGACERAVLAAWRRVLAVYFLLALRSFFQALGRQQPSPFSVYKTKSTRRPLRYAGTVPVVKYAPDIIHRQCAVDIIQYTQ